MIFKLIEIYSTSEENLDSRATPAIIYSQLFFKIVVGVNVIYNRSLNI